MRLLVASTSAALSLLAGCTLYFGGDDGDDVDPPCAYPANTGNLIAESVRLVNPETLACQTFYTDSCDGTCGPCPETTGAPQAIPEWGACASECLGLSENACRNEASCRIARRADYYYDGADGTAATNDDFLGCYPLSTGLVAPTFACAGNDAYTCSTNSACTAIYDAPNGVPCGNFKTPEACPGATFQQCVAETTTDPGVCHRAVACDALPPACAADETPGLLNGCWSGVCIPTEYCGAIED